MEYRKSVEQLCAKQGFDVAELAARTGLDPARVLAIVQGRWLPSPAERDRIAGAFGVNKDQIAWGHKAQIAHVYGHGPQFGRSP